MKTDLGFPLLNLMYFQPATSGKMSIERERYDKGKEFIVVSLRTHVLTGQRPAKCFAERPGFIHRLKEKDRGVWMSDLPCEIYQHAEFVPKLYGNVLIGGLGLGLILKMMSYMLLADSVTVVEKSEDVINLVWSQLNLPFKAKIIHKDLFKYLKTCKTRFDTAYYDIWDYDIWAGDNESAYHEYVKPLRYLSTGIVPQKRLHCWQEDVMKGQVKNHEKDKKLFQALKGK